MSNEDTFVDPEKWPFRIAPDLDDKVQVAEIRRVVDDLRRELTQRDRLSDAELLAMSPTIVAAEADEGKEGEGGWEG
jgi:hypothetical protein